MNIKLVNRGTTGELVLEGRLDSMSAPEADKAFEQVGERFELIILNVEKLEYVSSAGLRVIKKLYMQMARKGGSLELVKPQPLVMEVFEMTGFAGFLKIR